MPVGGTTPSGSAAAAGQVTCQVELRILATLAVLLMMSSSSPPRSSPAEEGQAPASRLCQFRALEADLGRTPFTWSHQAAPRRAEEADRATYSERLAWRTSAPGSRTYGAVPPPPPLPPPNSPTLSAVAVKGNEALSGIVERMGWTRRKATQSYEDEFLKSHSFHPSEAADDDPLSLAGLTGDLQRRRLSRRPEVGSPPNGGTRLSYGASSSAAAAAGSAPAPAAVAPGDDEFRARLFAAGLVDPGASASRTSTGELSLDGQEETNSLDERQSYRERLAWQHPRERLRTNEDVEAVFDELNDFLSALGESSETFRRIPEMGRPSVTRSIQEDDDLDLNDDWIAEMAPKKCAGRRSCSSTAARGSNGASSSSSTAELTLYALSAGSPHIPRQEVSFSSAVSMATAHSSSSPVGARSSGQWAHDLSSLDYFADQPDDSYSDASGERELRDRRLFGSDRNFQSGSDRGGRSESWRAYDIIDAEFDPRLAPK
mmetsp:Transcript_170642/g.547365  ORF Transcript_170642/g.547365 Transcript_170642/m.547365 type:complete len:488 (-) Transcript_170642:95-1558(-)